MTYLTRGNPPDGAFLKLTCRLGERSLAARRLDEPVEDVGDDAWRLAH